MRKQTKGSLMKINAEKEVEGECDCDRDGCTLYFLIPLCCHYNDTQVTAEGAKSMYHISRSMEADAVHRQAGETLSKQNCGHSQ